MSILMKIKGKLVKSQTDVQKRLTQRSASSQKKTNQLKGQDNAGSALLNRYEVIWSDVHSLLQTSIINSQLTGGEITAIAQVYSKQSEALTEFHKELSSVPDVISSIEVLLSQTQTLEAQMYATEDILLQLEDVCDNARAVKLRQKQISLVDDYQRKRNLDFQDSKVILARNHMEEVEAYEGTIQESLKERQKVFEHTYTQEIQSYKENQTTALRPTMQTEKLEHIDVVEDSSDLEVFLASENSESPEEK